MQDYNTIIGVIQMRQNDCSYSVVQNRYHIGSSTVTLIMERFRNSQLTLEQLKQKEPSDVEELFYPRKNLLRKDIPMPDFQKYYDRIHAKGSKANLAFCWIEYKQENPDRYEQSQFYEHYNKFVEQTYRKRDMKVAVSRKQKKKMYFVKIYELKDTLTDLEDVKIIVGERNNKRIIHYCITHKK